MAQTQTPSFIRHYGDSIPYTPSSATFGGDIVVFGTIVAFSPLDIAANTQGALTVNGVLVGPKDSSTFAAGDTVYWNATGNPTIGTAGTGCFTSTASGNSLAGFAEAAQLTGDPQVAVVLTAAKRTATLGGAVTADSVTGDMSTFPIAALNAAQGGSLSVTGGTSSTSANAGGAVTIVGGSPGATGVGGAVSMTGAIGGATSGAGGAASVVGGAGTNNAVGGVVTVTGGAGQGTGAGAAATFAGGASGAGATGNGGAISVTGGAALSTNGTGGAASLVGGVATGTGTGGAITITSGASGGASGTAGNVSIDNGSKASGTAGVIIIGDVNTLGTYLNRGPLKSLVVGITVTSIGTSQSSSPTIAQLLGGLITQTSSTGAGAVTLPTGTAISAGMPRTPVVGDSFDCDFANLGGSQTLTITGQTGSTVIGGAAVASGKSARMKFYNTGSNAWTINCIVGS